jgi:hypothetical protein
MKVSFALFAAAALRLAPGSAATGPYRPYRKP